MRSLVKGGYAAGPNVPPKPLCIMPNGKERERLGAVDWVPTEVTGVEVKRVVHQRPLRRKSQVLWLATALESAFVDTTK